MADVLLRGASGALAFLLAGLLVLLAAGSASSSSSNTGAITGTGYTVGFGELKEEWRGEIVHLSWSPRAFLLKGLLTDEECDHLVKKAKGHMQASSVVDSSTGRSVPSTVRTSTGTFLPKNGDEVIARIQKRLAQVTMIPQENQEGLQILNYKDGQKYEPHYDFFHDQLNADPAHGGQRVVTVLMYLTTVEDGQGGETVFPNADRKVSGPEWSECAKKGMAVKAIKGDAVMFYSLKPDGSTDQASLHGSCPTTNGGSKWSATEWIRVGPIGVDAAKERQQRAAAPGGCDDSNEQCTEWAFFGECEKNPGFMQQACKKSCGACPGSKKVPVQVS